MSESMVLLMPYPISMDFQGSIDYHLDIFRNCGINTVTSAFVYGRNNNVTEWLLFDITEDQIIYLKLVGGRERIWS